MGYRRGGDQKLAAPKKWIDDPNLKCVILCAGRGQRLSASANDLPKVLSTVNGRAILDYVVNYWRRFTQDFIFVVHYKKEKVIDFVRRLPVNTAWVEQPELRGIANALTYAAPLVQEKFILVLGDCMCAGDFAFPDEMQQGIGIWETDEPDVIRRSYSVEFDDRLKVYRVVEKPHVLPNHWCGLGYYFFDRRVFDYVHRTPPSALRGEIEITDVIQNMIDGNEPITAVPFCGNYLNVTFPEDLQRAAQIFSKKV